MWLKAQGLTYAEIGELTGWSYTKVNRCITEGRRAFIERYERIESGKECERWAPVLSAMADGEATAEQLVRGQTAPSRVLRPAARPSAPFTPRGMTSIRTSGAVLARRDERRRSERG